MAGHGEQDEQGQQRWRARFAKGRSGLSASVNDALASPNLEEAFDDELDDEPEPHPQRPHPILVPPRLSLQSKQMPAVHIAPDGQFRPMIVDTSPETNPVEALPVTQKKKRLAGRNTKVRLQAVPKMEKRSVKRVASSSRTIEPVLVRAIPAISETPVREGETETPVAVSLKRDDRPAREKLAGSGFVLQGQAEITVENVHVTSSSVVMVTLLGNPGPVVVQYYTLLPDYGFKVHLSAPATSNAPFNYVILLGELF